MKLKFANNRCFVKNHRLEQVEGVKTVEKFLDLVLSFYLS